MEVVSEILVSVFWVLVAITILVFVHEMGHFLFAKLFKMRVDRFSIGFPPKLFGKQIGETEYVVGATPLGGYVKIAGMIDESMDDDFLDAEPQPWEYRAKPVWQRMVVITAGVIFNIILAVVIFAGLKMAYGDRYVPAENVGGVYVADSSLAYEMGLRTGDRILAIGGEAPERYSDLQGVALLADPLTIEVERGGETLTLDGPPDVMTRLSRSGGFFGIDAMPTLVGSVAGESAAAEAGIQPGDRIIAIGGQPVQFWQEMTELIQRSEGEPILVEYARPDSLAEQTSASDEDAVSSSAERTGERDGAQLYQARVAPQLLEAEDRYMLGVGGPTEPMLASVFGERRESYGLFGAMAAGVEETWTSTALIAVSLKRIFTGRDSFRENVGGPIAIAQVTRQAARAGARSFWSIVAMLSITLAIMNILPIPALDGGHLMFLIYDAIARREPSLRVRMVMQQVGMILLLVFMTFVIFNDILRL
ncbi:MAG: RIP metalloprotease RseP [Rhodothermales bacterium]